MGYEENVPFLLQNIAFSLEKLLTDLVSYFSEWFQLEIRKDRD